MILTGSEAADLVQHEEALHDVTGLVAGHTRFALRLAGARAELQPLTHVALFGEPRTDLPPQLRREWQCRTARSVPADGACWAAAALLAALGLAMALATAAGVLLITVGMLGVTLVAMAPKRWWSGLPHARRERQRPGCGDPSGGADRAATGPGTYAEIDQAEACRRMGASSRPGHPMSSVACANVDCTHTETVAADPRQFKFP